MFDFSGAREREFGSGSSSRWWFFWGDVHVCPGLGLFNVCADLVTVI